MFNDLPLVFRIKIHVKLRNKKINRLKIGSLMPVDQRYFGDSQQCLVLSCFLFQ